MIDLPTRTMRWSGDQASEPLLTREWLVANGRGGYASGSIAGAPTRRFHGLLIAATPPPIGRAMLLNHLFDAIRFPDGTRVALGGFERKGGVVEVGVAPVLREFRLEGGLPIWKFVIGPFVIEKRIVVVHMQNTTHVAYRVLEGEGVLGLELRPSVDFRPHEGPVAGPNAAAYVLHAAPEGRYEIEGPREYPRLRLRIAGERHAFTIDNLAVQDLRYRIEEERGYDYLGSVWSPGFFAADLAKGRDVTLVASTESWETICALTPREALASEVIRRERLAASAVPEARAGIASELVLAADQFLITPLSRAEDAARAHAVGDEIRTVIAGYHWFTDWGRDTMISLEGLTLCTGRHEEAGYIIRTFAKYVRDGLIPNLFPEGASLGLYHTADATLWFFHAIDRYLDATGDWLTLELVLPVLREIFAKHMQGTHFGIGVDPADGLLRQGAEGYQLTWMDAKVGDWVVTPRRGKAVEINALFYNALELLGRWVGEIESDEAARPILDAAARVGASFNARFWNAERSCLFDVIDGPTGNDPAIRPNQLLAVSLPHPVLDPTRWRAVVDVAERELVTPIGLRSLAPGDPDFKARYFGDVRARDAAYHQGTVWAWLIGPFVDAWLKVHPGEEANAVRFVEGFAPHLGEADIGSISEVFDAEAPFEPRGCCAQAWSVAEVLRTIVRLRRARAL